MSRRINMSVCIYLALMTFMLTLKMAEPSFPMDLYDAVYVPKKSDSVFISPTNLKATLAVAALAAKGKTQEELLKSEESTVGSLYNDVLLPGRINNLKQDRHIFARKNLINDQIKTQLTPAYSFSDVVFGPTKSSKLINYGVSKSTKNKIRNIFPKGLSKNTALVAANSLYLRAPWKTEFTSIMKRGFKKPMVHQYGNFSFANLTDLNAAALQLEFLDNDAKLLVLQPNDNNLQRLGDQLLREDLTKIPKRLNKTYMSLYFPIIKEIKMSMSLKDALSTMGLDRSFSNNANFGNIMDACEEDAGLYLKDLRQHTSFKSDRQIAQFVAVTGLQMDFTNSTRSSCSCLADEYGTQFGDPAEIVDHLALSLRSKDAPHYYFDHKLFFALINKEDIMFIGTLAKEK